MMMWSEDDVVGRFFLWRVVTSYITMSETSAVMKIRIARKNTIEYTVKLCGNCNDDVRAVEKAT